MFPQTSLILILWLSPLLCQSQECSKSCLSDKHQKDDPQVWKYRCIQFYEQNNTAAFDNNSTCSKWNTVYTDLEDVFLNIFHLKWMSLESAFKGECPKNNLKDFTDIFNNEIMVNKSSGQKWADDVIGNLRPTCPLGLITGFLCLVDLDPEKLCNSADTTVGDCGAMPYICQDDLDAVIKLCLDDHLQNETLESLLKIMPVQDNACSSPHFIYLGQPSNRVLTRPTVVVSCVSENTAELRCFNGGQRIERATWKRNGTSYASTKGIATIVAQDGQHHLVNGNYTCFGDGAVIVTAYVKIHCHNKEVTEEPPTDDEQGTDSPPSPQNTKEFEHLWTNETIWPERNLRDINALDNSDFYPNKLSVVQITVNGRLTPVCGEDWNMRAAYVFCNELGARNNQSWNATFVGSIPRTEDTINPHYIPYIRDLDCKGGETHLIYCNHTGWGSKSCQHHAVVICREKVDEPSPGQPQLVIELALSGIGLLCLGLVGVLVWKCWIRKKSKPGDEVIHNPNNLTSTCITYVAEPLITEPPPSSVINPDFSFDFNNQMGPTITPVVEIKYRVKRVLKKSPPVLIVEVMENSMEVIAKEDKDGQLAPNGCYLIAEYSMLKELDHPNIVKCLLAPDNVTIEEFQENKRPRMFFMEYCSLGDLDEYLKLNGHDMTGDDMYSIVLGLAKALECLHSKGIVHGDVTADNVVLQQDPNGGLIPKLTDFGLSFRTSSIQSSPWGTYLYMAPELLIGEGEFRFPIKSDIYSFGMLVWEVLSWMACDPNKVRPRHISATSSDSGVQTGSTIVTLSDVTEREVMEMSNINPCTSDINTSCPASTQNASMFGNNYKKICGCRLKVHTAMIEQLERNKHIFSVTQRQEYVKDGMLTRPTKDVMEKFYNHFHKTGLPTPNTQDWDKKCFTWAVEVIEKCCREVLFRCSAKDIIKLIEDSPLYLRKDF